MSPSSHWEALTHRIKYRTLINRIATWYNNCRGPLFVFLEDCLCGGPAGDWLHRESSSWQRGCGRKSLAGLAWQPNHSSLSVIEICWDETPVGLSSCKSTRIQTEGVWTWADKIAQKLRLNICFKKHYYYLSLNICKNICEHVPVMFVCFLFSPVLSLLLGVSSRFCWLGEHPSGEHGAFSFLSCGLTSAPWPPAPWPATPWPPCIQDL